MTRKLFNFNAGHLLAILTIALSAVTANAQTSKDSTKSKTATITFTVTEMDCKTDSKMVETALYRKKGVKSVKTTEDVMTIVYYPEKIKPEELKAVIENTGTCEDPDARVHKVSIKTP